MRIVLSVAALVAISACSAQVPDSGAGVGFGDYDTYLEEKKARDAQLAGNPIPPAGAMSDEPLDGFHPVNRSTPGEQIAADAQAVLNETQANSGETVVHASPANPAPEAVLSPTGISQENDFEAVGSQRSIEGDAARIEANKQQYKVIEAEALPTRSGRGGPNIVDYALRSNHPRGTQIYRRLGVNLTAKSQRNCAKYPSPDLAQAEFLEKGGPQRDRLGLDPDGDGYACTWDPTPFRKAVSG